MNSVAYCTSFFIYRICRWKIRTSTNDKVNSIQYVGINIFDSEFSFLTPHFLHTFWICEENSTIPFNFLAKITKICGTRHRKRPLDYLFYTKRFNFYKVIKWLFRTRPKPFEWFTITIYLIVNIEKCIGFPRPYYDRYDKNVAKQIISNHSSCSFHF